MRRALAQKQARYAELTEQVHVCSCGRLHFSPAGFMQSSGSPDQGVVPADAALQVRQLRHLH